MSYVRLELIAKHYTSKTFNRAYAPDGSG